MTENDELWIPLVDEPIGSIVQQIVDENIRCGLLLGQLLFDHDVPDYDGSESWIEALLKNPAHHDALANEVRKVAQEIAADPKYADDEPLGPDDDARARFREFAREQLGR
jgi:hypothetical protein